MIKFLSESLSRMRHLHIAWTVPCLILEVTGFLLNCMAISLPNWFRISCNDTNIIDVTLGLWQVCGNLNVDNVTTDECFKLSHFSEELPVWYGSMIFTEITGTVASFFTCILLCLYIKTPSLDSPHVVMSLTLAMFSSAVLEVVALFNARGRKEALVDGSILKDNTSCLQYYISLSLSTRLVAGGASVTLCGALFAGIASFIFNPHRFGSSEVNPNSEHAGLPLTHNKHSRGAVVNSVMYPATKSKQKTKIHVSMINYGKTNPNFTYD